MVEALGLVTTLLIGGVLADRYSRRLLLIGSDLARALVIGGSRDRRRDRTPRPSASMIAFVALHGLGSGLFQPAFGGILPLLVEEPSLGSANALVGVSRQTAFVVGPAIAGLIYDAAGSSAIFAVDAASFVVSATCSRSRVRELFERASSRALRRELSVRLSLRRSRCRGSGSRSAPSRSCSWSASPPSRCCCRSSSTQEWDGGVGAYGLLFTLQGIGMVIGSVDPRADRAGAPPRHAHLLTVRPQQRAAAC